MKVVDGIAAQGVQNGAQDGPPVATTDIAKVTVPGDALEGTGTYATATPVRPGDRRAVHRRLSVDTGAVDTGSVDTGAATPTAEVAPTAEPTAAETTGGAG